MVLSGDCGNLILEEKNFKILYLFLLSTKTVIPQLRMVGRRMLHEPSRIFYQLVYNVPSHLNDEILA